MKVIICVCFVFVILQEAYSFSKYGRTCKDIGCSRNEICVMATTPCSVNSKGNDCGSYPTCKKISNAAPTCATYICPPTKKCILDGDTPKCVNDTKIRQNISAPKSGLRNKGLLVGIK